MALALIAAASILSATPQIPQLPPIRRDPQITYLDRSGAVIGVRGGRYGPPVNIDRLPAYVPAAFVAIEDRRFYSHDGFDPMGMARALVADLEAGRAREGASTITQQLARNLFLDADRTMERKATELVYAVELEQTYSKKQILGLYLSRVYFGEGAYGIDAAAERYFDRPAAKLTIREAATLAALMKSPAEYDPIEHPERSEERTRLVLDAMVETGAITPGRRAEALAQNPHLWRTARTAAAQWFVDWVDAQTRQAVGRTNRDLVVDTTLDLPSEAAAGEEAKAVADRYAGRGVQQAALVALDGEGRVRAMIGGVDYATGPYDRAVDARRQVGSAWKPFVYLAALENGRTPDTLVVDEPVTIDGWTPADFEPEYLGQITLQTALARSINTVAARLADEVGRPLVAADARRLGIVSPINTDPAMALGTSQVSPLEMAQAYGAFANGGNRVHAYGVERIRYAGGPVIYQHRGEAPQPVIANPPLSELDGMLKTVLQDGGTGVRAAIPGRDLAGKTGTTSDFRDAWFCGFTGNLTTVVWMGRDDDKPMSHVTGGSAPVDLWRTFMLTAMHHLPNAPIPPGPPAPVPVLEVANPPPLAIPPIPSPSAPPPLTAPPT
ncbi:MAG TPA: PBP1A family penicillin-binding protein [Caulobacteraceae bacterium]|nr:PBP1A family penicillin-binding protein [Caulobacteraceae bacterium]